MYLLGAGVVHLVAAAGIYLGRTWGRLLGIVIAVIGLLVVLGIGLFAVLLARAVSAEVPGSLLVGLVPLAVCAGRCRTRSLLRLDERPGSVRAG